jgi:hypothetical protein
VIPSQLQFSAFPSFAWGRYMISSPFPLLRLNFMFDPHSHSGAGKLSLINRVFRLARFEKSVKGKRVSW